MNHYPTAWHSGRGGIWQRPGPGRGGGTMGRLCTTGGERTHWDLGGSSWDSERDRFSCQLSAWKRKKNRQIPNFSGVAGGCRSSHVSVNNDRHLEITPKNKTTGLVLNSLTPISQTFSRRKIKLFLLFLTGMCS